MYRAVVLGGWKAFQKAPGSMLAAGMAALVQLAGLRQ
jgi:hypothetical protein